MPLSMVNDPVTSAKPLPLRDPPNWPPSLLRPTTRLRMPARDEPFPLERTSSPSKTKLPLPFKREIIWATLFPLVFTVTSTLARPRDNVLSSLRAFTFLMIKLASACRAFAALTVTAPCSVPPKSPPVKRLVFSTPLARTIPMSALSRRYWLYVTDGAFKLTVASKARNPERSMVSIGQRLSERRLERRAAWCRIERPCPIIAGARHADKIVRFWRGCFSSPFWRPANWKKSLEALRLAGKNGSTIKCPVVRLACNLGRAPFKSTPALPLSVTFPIVPFKSFRSIFLASPLIFAVISNPPIRPLGR